MNFSSLKIHVNDISEINVCTMYHGYVNMVKVSWKFETHFLEVFNHQYLKFPDILKFFDILKFSLVPPSSHIEIWLYGHKHLQVSLLPARYHPKLNFLEGDLVASIRARRLIIKLAKSVSKWAASDIMAKLPANTPPANIFVLYMNKEKNNCWATL